MAVKFPTEAKVGIFVLVTLASLIYLSIRINRAGISIGDSKTIYIVFTNASGILQRTPVEYAGIRVGFVEDIQLVDGKAKVKTQIEGKVPLYEDSVVDLKTRGILGEKIITVMG